MVLDRLRLTKRLNKIFLSSDVERLVIYNASSNNSDPNFRYLTGFISGLFEGDYLIAEKESVKVLCYPLEFELAIKQSFPGIEIVCIDNFTELKTVLKREISGKKTGINGELLPIDSYFLLEKISGNKPIDISKSLITARLTKDTQEIKDIKRACKVTKKSIRDTFELLSPGLTEKKISHIFNDLLLENGADSNSFENIICFGKNASQPHHTPDNTRLKKGDFVLMDVGAKIRGYCSDITRTRLFKKSDPKSDEKKQEIVDLVLNTQKLAISSIKPGIKAKDVHIIAESAINSYLNGKFKDKFIHSLGHSIGIDVHDGGRLSRTSEIELSEDMVFTVEPGVYLENFGGARFEDVIVVRKNRAEIL